MDRNLKLLGLGAAIRTLGAALYAPFLALFLHDGLGVSFVLIGVIIVALGVVQLPFQYAGGLLADRIGRRRLIVLGLAGEAAATVVLAFAFFDRSLPLALIAALAGGIVAGGAGPASTAYIADFATGSERTVGMTWYRIGFNAGFSAGATLGGIVAAIYGFPWAVALGAVIIGVGAAVLAVTLNASPYDRALALRRVPPVAIPEASGPTGPPSRSVRASLSLLGHDRVALAALGGFLFTALVAGQWAVTFPLFVHEKLGVSYAVLGAGLALNGLVVVVGQAPMTAAVLGRRHSSIAIAGLVLYVVAFVGLGAAGAIGFGTIGVFVVAVLVLTLGENLLAIPQSVLPSNLAPPGEVGAYNGAFQTFPGIGFLAAVFLGGVALSTIADPLLLWLVLSAPAVGAVIFFRMTAARAPRSVDRA